MKSCLAFALTLISFNAFADGLQKPWVSVRCADPNTEKVFVIDRNEDATLTVGNEKTRAFINRIPCTRIEPQSPLFYCNQALGSDQITFRSEERHERGFAGENNYGQFQDRHLLVIYFQRYYTDGKGEYKQLRRQYQFQKEQCVIQ